MNAQQEATISTLRHLIETARDGQEGFRKAAESVVDDHELKRLLSALSLQRAKFAGELESISIIMGEHSPETGGSISGSVHRWWMEVRSAMTKDDNHAVLAECERGEDMAVQAYNSALEYNLPHPVREVLIRQRREVVADHHTIRALRDATPDAATRLLATARERCERATHEAHLALESVKEKGQEWMENAKEHLEIATPKEVKRLARRRPFLLLGGGLLAGLGIGLLLHSLERRRQSQKGINRLGHWMGQMKERAREQAHLAASQLRR